MDRLNTAVASKSGGEVEVPATKSDLSTAMERQQRSPRNAGGAKNRKCAKMLCGLEFVPMKKQEPLYKAFARRAIENTSVVAFTMALTIYALIGDDLRLLCTSRESDPFFNVMVIICLICFSVEIVLSVLGKQDYLWSFFFHLDVVSTASLVLDLTIVSEAMLAAQSDDGGGGSQARGGRAAKIGAKAGRVVRVLRLIRILKLYKAYYEARARENRKKRMQAQQGKTPGEDDDWDDDDLAETPNLEQSHRESNVGKKLSELTIRRVICLILALLLGLPVMQAEVANQAAFSAHYGAEHVYQNFNVLAGAGDQSTWLQRNKYEDAMLRYVYFHNWFAYADSEDYCPSGECANVYYAHLFWMGLRGEDFAVIEANTPKARISDIDVLAWQGQNSNSKTMYSYGRIPKDAQEAITGKWDKNCDTENFKSRGLSLLSQEIEGLVSLAIDCPDELRPNEVLYVVPRLISQSTFNDLHMAFAFDLRPFVKMDAVYNLLNTFTVLVLLVVVSLIFSSDSNRLIVHPVERMIKRVEAIRDNPLIAMRMSDEEFKAEEVAKAKKARAKKEYIKHLAGEILSGQICRARSGEPMETVILEKTIIKLGSLLALGFGEAGANIIGTNMRGGDSAGVNAMIPGTRVECIIGVVRIRDFSTATEVLQSKIMTFVNQIAEIVHGVANEYKGAPNKNSGETFLIIWRIEDITDTKEVSKLAGLSIMAFSKMLGGLHKSALIATYRGHPGLQYRLGANCRVNLSFGLHAGWAIEGAVGSEFKIDASYLSPNVSIATSVERATQNYGVTMIVARSVVELCPKEVVSKCRLIDRVVITGSATPTEIYCVDLDYRSITVDQEPPLNVVWNTRNRFKVRQFLESEKAAMENENFNVAQALGCDPIFQQMRKRYTVEFFQLFNMGFQNYAQGEWPVARRMLSCTRAILGTEDGPSSALLRHMEVPHNFKAPPNWQGVRDLSTSMNVNDS